MTRAELVAQVRSLAARLGNTPDGNLLIEAAEAIERNPPPVPFSREWYGLGRVDRMGNIIDRNGVIL